MRQGNIYLAFFCRFFRLIAMKKLFCSLAFFLFLAQVMMAQTPQLALVLSGGGARCFAHIGVLKSLDEAGIKPDLIVGTSMGAVIGGLYAIGYTGEEIEQLFLAIDWDEIFLDKVNRDQLYISQKRWSPIGTFYLRIDEEYHLQAARGLVGGQRIMNTLSYLTYKAAHIRDFNDFSIPFRAVATNLVNGSTKVFKEGVLAEAMRASSSIPSIMEPFRIDGDIYLDGGITMNLPTAVAREGGAMFIIASQVNSILRDEARLTNVISVLDQTLNIAINQKTAVSALDADFLIESQLPNYYAYDFKKIKEIIDLGKAATTAQLSQLSTLPQEGVVNTPTYLANTILATQIKIDGNVYVSAEKIRRMAGIQRGKSYSAEEIYTACERIFNSQLFDYVYPVINQNGETYCVKIICKEAHRRRVGLNLNYNENDHLSLGIVWQHDNLFLKNSKFIGAASIGGQREFSADFTKNFGRIWGGYYRFQPYIKESKHYSYDDEHRKVAGVNSFEKGISGGVGGFASNFAVLEAYAYAYQKRLYKDILNANFPDREHFSSGLGIKLYHESLNNYTFPMCGAQINAKFNYAQEGKLSNSSYKKILIRSKFVVPLENKLSGILALDYGSYFGDEVTNLDPFYVGGLDSFIGWYQKEYSAPIYKLVSLSLRYRYLRNWYFDLQVNGANFSATDMWKLVPSDVYTAGGIRIGYDSVFGPVRGAVSFNDDNMFNYYLSVGYSFGSREFSGR